MGNHHPKMGKGLKHVGESPRLGKTFSVAIGAGVGNDRNRQFLTGFVDRPQALIGHIKTLKGAMQFDAGCAVILHHVAHVPRAYCTFKRIHIGRDEGHEPRVLLGDFTVPPVKGNQLADDSGINVSELSARFGFRQSGRKRIDCQLPVDLGGEQIDDHRFGYASGIHLHQQLVESPHAVGLVYLSLLTVFPDLVSRFLSVPFFR